MVRVGSCFFCFCFVIVSYHCDITSLSNYIKKNIMYRFINFYLVYNKKMDCLVPCHNCDKKNIMYRFINFYLVYNKKMDCLEQIKN